MEKQFSQIFPGYIFSFIYYYFYFFFFFGGGGGGRGWTNHRFFHLWLNSTELILKTKFYNLGTRFLILFTVNLRCKSWYIFFCQIGLVTCPENDIFRWSDVWAYSTVCLLHTKKITCIDASYLNVVCLNPDPISRFHLINSGSHCRVVDKPLTAFSTHCPPPPPPHTHTIHFLNVRPDLNEMKSPLLTQLKRNFCFCLEFGEDEDRRVSGGALTSADRWISDILTPN